MPVLCLRFITTLKKWVHCIVSRHDLGHCLEWPPATTPTDGAIPRHTADMRSSNKGYHSGKEVVPASLALARIPDTTMSSASSTKACATCGKDASMASVQFHRVAYCNADCHKAARLEVSQEGMLPRWSEVHTLSGEHRYFETPHAHVPRCREHVWP